MVGRFQKTMNKEYDVIDDATKIVEHEFGNDWDNSIKYICDLKVHTDSCGCGRCRAYYKSEIIRKAKMFIAPDRSNVKFDQEYEEVCTPDIDDDYDDYDDYEDWSETPF